MRPVLLALSLFGIGVAGGTAGADPRAVVELFTSQGCSSCPPADRLMGEWARDPDIVALSLPVDYWDYLGWRDTLASHDFTLRQQAYSHVRGDRDVYTPQVVVDGVTHVVGSQKASVEAAIRARPDGLPVKVGIADSVGGFIVSAGPGPGSADIFLVPVRRAARVSIERGENSGASITYSNVARGMRKIGQYDGKPITLTLTREEVAAPGADTFAILVQRMEDGLPGPILGATMRREGTLGRNLPLGHASGTRPLSGARQAWHEARRRAPMIDRDDISAAAKRIGAHVRRTPVMELASDALGPSGPINLKLEFLQHAGSFKPRGAFNNLLSRPVPTAGVAAASGGNHGIAVAFAARALGHQARIFVPAISSPAKVAAIRACGADLVVGGERFADAQEACDAYVADSGALRIHPFDAWETIAGQASVALEWESQAPDLDTVLVAVGGGGLIAGIGLWFEGRTKVIGVEPEGSRCLYEALRAGRPVDVSVDSIAADSLGARNCGARVFEAARRTVDEVVLVQDRAIEDAQRLLWRDLRMAVEPGGATALSALASGAYRPRPESASGCSSAAPMSGCESLAGLAQPLPAAL